MPAVKDRTRYGPAPTNSAFQNGSCRKPALSLVYGPSSRCFGMGWARSLEKSVSAWMNGSVQVTVKVRASLAWTDSITSYAASRKTGSSRSRTTVIVNRRSSVVNGVPSCQRAFSRIFQVVSVRPSGRSFQSPFSNEGTASASLGWGTSAPSRSDRPSVMRSSTSEPPRRRIGVNRADHAVGQHRQVAGDADDDPLASAGFRLGTGAGRLAGFGAVGRRGAAE